MLPFIEKLKPLQALASFKLADEEMKAEFERIVKDATELNGKRNRFVHAEYKSVVGPDDELMKMLPRRLNDATKMEQTGRPDFRSLLQPVDASERAKLAHDLHALAYRMRVLEEKFVDWNL